MIANLRSGLYDDAEPDEMPSCPICGEPAEQYLLDANGDMMCCNNCFSVFNWTDSVEYERRMQ